MDFDAKMKAIKDYFDSHTQKQLREMYYKDDIKALNEFDRKLLEKVIENQIELDDERLLYCHEKDGTTEFLNIFNTFRNILELPWVECDNVSFPTQFIVLEHGGKRMVLSLMIGQGSAMDFCTVDGFKNWMERIKATYEWPETAISVDDVEKKVTDALAYIKNQIDTAKDTLD